MNINLYSFKKKYNSTKRPTGSGRTFDCTLVENTSLLSPSVRLKAPSDLIGKVKEPVTPGSLVTIQDSNALLDEPIPTLQAGVLYDGTPKSSLTITKTGKNVCFADETNRSINSDGSISANASYKILKAYVKAGISYTVTTTSSQIVYSYYETIPVYQSASYTGTRVVSNNKTITAEYSMYIAVRVPADDNTAFIEVGTTATAYQAYTSENIIVNFPDPIYGGYYNADTGILSVTKDSTGADLPTPYPMYQCTPHDIYLNADVTNIWCNTGAIESCYYWKYQSGAGRMYQYNYAFIPDMDRYYWIKDIRYELGTWVFDLSIDVLASWKNTIGSSSHYIERSSYTFDGTIIDGMYPEKADPDLVIVEPDKVSNVLPTIFGTTISPSFIVGIIGGIASENISHIGEVYNGSVVYFSLTQAQLGQLVSLLMDSVSLYEIPTGEISEELQKQLINPIQYIHSIKCVPFKPNTSGQDPNGYVATAFLCGFQYVPLPTGTTWDICKAPAIGDITKDNGYLEKRSVLLKLPIHPEYSNRGKWVLGSPISKYVFDVSPFGQFEISSGDILSAPITIPLEGDPYIQMEVTTVTDISTGDCTLFLNWGGTSKPEEAFFKITKHIAVDVPVHQAIQDAMGFRQDMRQLNQQIIGSVGSFIKSGTKMVGNIAGGILGAATESVGIANQMMNTVDSATKANQVSISGNGNEGSYMSFNKDLTVPRVRCYFSPLAEEHNEERGKPLCQVKRINTIPGYVVTSGADFSSAGTMDENTQIVQLMNGGFFYE